MSEQTFSETLACHAGQIYTPDGTWVTPKEPVLRIFDGDAWCDPKRSLVTPDYEQNMARFVESVVAAGYCGSSGQARFDFICEHVTDRATGELFDEEQIFIDREVGAAFHDALDDLFGASPSRTMARLRAVRRQDQARSVSLLSRDASSGMTLWESAMQLDQSVLNRSILTGQLDQLQLIVWHANDVPDDTACAYAQLAMRAQAEHPSALRSFDFERIRSGDNLLGFIVEDNVLRAACYASRITEDTERSGLIYGCLVSDGQIKGAGKMLVAGLAAAETYWSTIPPFGRAVARVLPSGAINQASSAVFASMGFVSTHVSLEPVSARDIHLISCAVRLRDGNPRIGCLHMQASAKRLAQACKRVLREGWSLHFRQMKNSPEQSRSA